MPDSLMAYEADLSVFAIMCRELCKQLLRLFALGLKVCIRESALTDADADFAGRSTLRKVARNGLLNIMILRRDRQAASYVSFGYDLKSSSCGTAAHRK